MAKKRIALASAYSVIEPLGLMHLAGVAKEEGWEPRIFMVRGDNFEEFNEKVGDFSPNLLGFSIYTGDHVQIFDYLDGFRMINNTPVVVGGPHPTYFPRESKKHADYVVLSEGFNGLRRILRGEAKPGIVPLEKQEHFPLPDREGFYAEHPEKKASRIKSIMTHVGCPYSCTYCYNSSTLESIAGELGESELRAMEASLGGRHKRLFPANRRRVEDVIAEVADIKRVSPETEMIYFQDDVFGASTEWVDDFARVFPQYGLTYHAQLRFEYAARGAGQRRLHLMKNSGCTGITFAVECANPTVREEVLNRHMHQSMIVETMQHLRDLGLKCRIEQMIGLPCGATKDETPVNLEADFETLDFNIKLREETGLPTVAWASIFSPYRGTVLGEYCRKHGFYRGDYGDIPKNFFGRSTLQFPRAWTGPGLSADDKDAWLSDEENEKYKDQMKLLREVFQLAARLPDGTAFARKFVSRDGLGTGGKVMEALAKDLKTHTYNHEMYEVEGE